MNDSTVWSDVPLYGSLHSYILSYFEKQVLKEYYYGLRLAQYPQEPGHMTVMNYLNPLSGTQSVRGWSKFWCNFIIPVYPG